MFSLALFLPLVMASAFSFDLVTNESLPIISNNSWSASIQLNNSTQPIPGVPPAPPAFEAEIKINPANPLDSYPVYLVAVEAMYKLAQVAWHRAIETQTRINQAYSNVAVIITSTQSAGAIYQLENSHVILGLYRGILMMIALSWWYDALISLKVHGIVVGYINIAGPQQRTAINGIAAVSPAKAAAARSLEGPSLLRGRSIDPEDRSFQLQWTHQTESSSMMAQEAIYTAVLSGLADAAFYDPGTFVSEVNTKSEVVGPSSLDYWCNFRISTDPDDGYPGPLTYYLVTKTFRNVAGFIMPEAHWYGEYDLDLYYQQKLNAYVEVTKVEPD